MSGAAARTSKVRIINNKKDSKRRIIDGFHKMKKTQARQNRNYQKIGAALRYRRP